MKGVQKGFFERMASTHSTDAVLVPEGSRFRNLAIDKVMRKTLIPILTSYSNTCILDVGCGVGRWTQVAASANNSVVALDMSESMIKIAKEQCKDRECSFVIAEASNLPFKADAFEVVMTITVLQHILNEKVFKRAISEIRRCTKSDAMIVDQMSGHSVELLENVYSPIRIVPAKPYAEELARVGLRPSFVAGLTFTPITALLTEFLGTQNKLVGRDESEKFKSSRFLSGVLHFIMGVGTLPALLLPLGSYTPSLCLHTLILSTKIRTPEG